MEPIKEWFSSLDEKDQKITIAAGIGLVIFVVYFLLLEPLNESVDDLEKRVASQQKTVNWMKQQIPIIRGTTGVGNGNQSQLPLASVVNNTTNIYSLPVSRRDSKSPNEMQIWFDNVSFNSFLQWSSEISTKHGVTIVSVNIRSRDRNGIASINVKLLK
ncbi:MAG: type II secretion system protein M [Kangiellaceae bacterium]|nr:type II secretion system protein M [Kangiellaceae bacterium]